MLCKLFPFPSRTGKVINSVAKTFGLSRCVCGLGSKHYSGCTKETSSVVALDCSVTTRLARIFTNWACVLNAPIRGSTTLHTSQWRTHHSPAAGITFTDRFRRISRLFHGASRLTMHIFSGGEGTMKVIHRCYAPMFGPAFPGVTTSVGPSIWHDARRRRELAPPRMTDAVEVGVNSPAYPQSFSDERDATGGYYGAKESKKNKRTAPFFLGREGWQCSGA